VLLGLSETDELSFLSTFSLTGVKITRINNSYSVAHASRFT